MYARRLERREVWHQVGHDPDAFTREMRKRLEARRAAAAAEPAGYLFPYQDDEPAPPPRRAEPPFEGLGRAIQLALIVYLIVAIIVLGVLPALFDPGSTIYMDP